MYEKPHCATSAHSYASLPPVSSLCTISVVLCVPGRVLNVKRISALPDDVLARTKGAIGEKEGKVDHKTNIEIIKMEERKIKEEEIEQKEAVKPEPIVIATTKKDEITTKDVKVLEQALDTIAKDKKLAVEKGEIKELKEELAEYQEDVQELAEIKAAAKGEVVDLKVSKGANRLFNKVNKMIGKLDTVLTELEKSEEKVKKKIETLKPEEKADSEVVEELVRIDELIAAIKQIQSVPDESRLTRISEILGKIDDDRDGAIKIEDVLKVVELIGEEDVKLNKKQLNELIDLMDKEEVLEVEDQISKALMKEGKEKNDEVQPEKTAVPSTPVTKSSSQAEELKDEITPKITVKAEAEELRDSAPVLKDPLDSETVRSPPITGVPPPKAKKTEGSKQL